MAFRTLRDTVGDLRSTVRSKRTQRDPGQRNYMKKKANTDPAADAALQELLQKTDSKKAPFAEKTKGFYRFSRSFPDTVDAEGYRVNGKSRENPTKKGLVFSVFVLAVLLFCATFVLTDISLDISDAAPTTTEAVSEEAGSDITAPATSPDAFGNQPMPLPDEIATDPVVLPTQEHITDVTEPTAPLLTEPTTLPPFADAPVEDGNFGGGNTWN